VIKKERNDFNMDLYEKIKYENDLLFTKMATKYKIPLKYKDSSQIFFKNKISKLKIYSNKYKELKNIIDDYNDMYEEVQYKFPKKTGEVLEKIFEDKESILGIHRTNLTNKQIEEKIFTYGLKNRSLEYTTTIQTSKSFPFILNEIKNASGYKNSNNCVIVVLPKEQKLPIYYELNSEFYLLPEYILGYINVDDLNLNINPNYKAIHDYDTNNLFYVEIIAIKKDKTY
jgi:hypothetical protein